MEQASWVLQSISRQRQDKNPHVSISSKAEAKPAPVQNRSSSIRRLLPHTSEEGPERFYRDQTKQGVQGSVWWPRPQGAPPSGQQHTRRQGKLKTHTIPHTARPQVDCSAAVADPASPDCKGTSSGKVGVGLEYVSYTALLSSSMLGTSGADESPPPSKPSTGTSSRTRGRQDATRAAGGAAQSAARRGDSTTASQAAVYAGVEYLDYDRVRHCVCTAQASSQKGRDSCASCQRGSGRHSCCGRQVAGKGCEGAHRSRTSTRQSGRRDASGHRSRSSSGRVACRAGRVSCRGGAQRLTNRKRDVDAVVLGDWLGGTCGAHDWEHDTAFCASPRQKVRGLLSLCTPLTDAALMGAHDAHEGPCDQAAVAKQLFSHEVLTSWSSFDSTSHLSGPPHDAHGAALCNANEHDTAESPLSSPNSADTVALCCNTAHYREVSLNDDVNDDVNDDANDDANDDVNDDVNNDTGTGALPCVDAACAAGDHVGEHPVLVLQPTYDRSDLPHPPGNDSLCYKDCEDTGGSEADCAIDDLAHQDCGFHSCTMSAKGSPMDIDSEDGMDFRCAASAGSHSQQADAPCDVAAVLDVTPLPACAPTMLATDDNDDHSGDHDDHADDNDDHPDDNDDHPDDNDDHPDDNDDYPDDNDDYPEVAVPPKTPEPDDIVANHSIPSAHASFRQRSGVLEWDYAALNALNQIKLRSSMALYSSESLGEKSAFGSTTAGSHLPSGFRQDSAYVFGGEYDPQAAQCLRRAYSHASERLTADHLLDPVSLHLSRMLSQNMCRQDSVKLKEQLPCYSPFMDPAIVIPDDDPGTMSPVTCGPLESCWNNSQPVSPLSHPCGPCDASEGHWEGPVTPGYTSSGFPGSSPLLLSDDPSDDCTSNGTSWGVASTSGDTLWSTRNSLDADSVWEGPVDSAAQVVDEGGSAVQCCGVDDGVCGMEVDGGGAKEVEVQSDGGEKRTGWRHVKGIQPGLVKSRIVAFLRGHQSL